MHHDTDGPPTVLVVSHPDGYLQAFARGGVAVRIAELPQCNTPEAEVLAEELARLRLPLRFRNVWDDCNIATTLTLTRPMVEQLAQIAADVDLLEALKQLSEPIICM